MSGIFLDRDGVIVRKAPEGEYLADWSEVEFLPGALEAISAFHRHGRLVIIVTNQRGVATGKIQPSKLDEIHTRLKSVIARHGGQIAEIYCCSHDTSKDCLCRKPRPGMLLEAAEKHHLQLSDCWMIGDAPADIVAGKRAGCKTALITQSTDFQKWAEKPDLSADSLASLATFILVHPFGR